MLKTKRGRENSGDYVFLYDFDYDVLTQFTVSQVFSRNRELKRWPIENYL